MKLTFSVLKDKGAKLGKVVVLTLREVVVANEGKMYKWESKDLLYWCHSEGSKRGLKQEKNGIS